MDATFLYVNYSIFNFLKVILYIKNLVLKLL